MPKNAKDPGLRYIFMDIDGVLADCRHRLHYIQGEKKDYDAFYDAVDKDGDYGNDPSIDLFGELSETYGGDVILITGRPERARAKTEAWLKEHYGSVPQILMRSDHDWRPAPQVKGDLLKKFFDGKDIKQSMLLDDMEDNLVGMSEALAEVSPNTRVVSAKITPVQDDDDESEEKPE